MRKEYEVTFLIDGVNSGSGFIAVNDDTLSTESAEEEFYKTLRKNEKYLILEAKEEWKGEIVDKLTPAQEETLKDEHAKYYHGLDDDMADDFEDWLTDLSYDELKEILK